MTEETKKDWIEDSELRDKLIKKMVLLLREGHRMLDETCPVCSAILFLRKDVGLRYCPNCDVYLATPEEVSKLDSSKVKIIGEVTEGGIIKSAESTSKNANRISNEEIRKEAILQTSTEKIEESEVSKLVESLIKKLLNQASRMLEMEINRLRTEDILEMLKLLIEIRKLL